MAEDVESLRGRVEDLAERVALLERRGGVGGGAGVAPAQGVGAPGADLGELVRSLLAPGDRSAAVALGVGLRRRDGSTVASTSSLVWGTGGPQGDLRETARVLSALGSDTRLRLMQLLWQEELGGPELAQASGLSTGSLYHHVRELIALRWIDAPQRNRYVLTVAGRKALAVACAVGRFVLPE